MGDVNEGAAESIVVHSKEDHEVREDGRQITNEHTVILEGGRVGGREGRREGGSEGEWGRERQKRSLSFPPPPIHTHTHLHEGLLSLHCLLHVAGGGEVLLILPKANGPLPQLVQEGNEMGGEQVQGALAC